MPTSKLSNLMSQLHQTFDEADPSPQQARLLMDLEAHIHSTSQGAPITPTPLETVELMLDSLGDDHPRTEAVLRELIDTLKTLGF